MVDCDNGAFLRYVVWQPEPQGAPSMATAVEVGAVADLSWDVGGANEVHRTGLVQVPWTGATCPQDLDNATDSLAQRFVDMLTQRAPHVRNTTATATENATFGHTFWSADRMWSEIPTTPDATSDEWSPYIPR